MKTQKIMTLFALLPLSVASGYAEAGVSLSGKDHCYTIDGNPPGAWSQTFRIKVGNPVFDRAGSVVKVTGVEQGFKAVYPPLTYYNGLAGAAFYLPPSDQETGAAGQVEISLTGESYGTSDATSSGVHGLFSLEYVMLLDQSRGPGLGSGKIILSKTFKALDPGHAKEPAETSYEVRPVSEILCRGAGF